MRIFRNAITVSFFTGLSRTLGFVREMVMAHYFGTSLAKSAFDVAFRIPNLFRSLFGEGALSAAFVPVFAEALAKEGRDKANRLAGQVLTMLAFFLILITAAGTVIITISMHYTTEGTRLAAVLPLMRIMLPYMVFICLVALGMGIQATGATTAALPSINLPGFSDIYAGGLAIPYYLHKDQPLSGYWQTANDGAVTRYHPLPTATATLQIPVLMTVPNAKSGWSKPANGWPVVIFQHGITKDRTNLLALADALSFAGYAAVAIDLPLHGVTNPMNPFYMKGMERTFDLDVVNNQTSAADPDGVIDASGAHFINLNSLLTSRDNVREAAQDLRQLTATLPLVDLNSDGNPDLNAESIYFVGHSLGAITGATFLGIEDKIASATLGMGGGGIAKLLDGSAAFGPIIAAGLASAGVIKDTPAYENFMDAAQTVIDAGDPINYATAAARLHPIHLIEVVGGANSASLPDQVVPNSVENAPLAGTEPLARVMSLPSASRSAWNDQGVRAIVRFNQGDHGTLLQPNAATLGVTAEMQGQMIRFLQTEGVELEIIYHPVIQH